MYKGQEGVRPISGGSERGQEKEATGNVVREGSGGAQAGIGAQAGNSEFLSPAGGVGTLF